MAVERSDVDLGKRQLSVARSDWKGQVTATKGGRVRYVPMTVRLAEALKQASKQARSLEGSRVMCDKKGTPLSQKEVQVIMRRVGRRANVKPGVHILRHTFCSHLAMRGAPAKAIQGAGGPSGPDDDAAIHARESGSARCSDQTARRRHPQPWQ